MSALSLVHCGLLLTRKAISSECASVRLMQDYNNIYFLKHLNISPLLSVCRHLELKVFLFYFYLRAKKGK